MSTKKNSKKSQRKNKNVSKITQRSNEIKELSKGLDFSYNLPIHTPTWKEYVDKFYSDEELMYFLIGQLDAIPLKYADGTTEVWAFNKSCLPSRFQSEVLQIRRTEHKAPLIFATPYSQPLDEIVALCPEMNFQQLTSESMEEKLKDLLQLVEQGKNIACSFWVFYDLSIGTKYDFRQRFWKAFSKYQYQMLFDGIFTPRTTPNALDRLVHNTLKDQTEENYPPLPAGFTIIKFGKDS